MHLLIPPPGGAFVFDKDGTLLDTEAVWFEAYERLLRQHHATPHDLATHRRMMGAAPLACLEILREVHAELPRDLEALLEERLVCFRAVRRERGVHPLPGVVTFLERCRAKGIPLAIATGATRATASEELTLLGWDSWFTTIVTADDVTQHKPAPETFLEAARRLGVEPAHCIAFEDGLKGFASATSAGMPTVFVRDLRFEVSVPAGAHLSIASFTELDLA